MNPWRDRREIGNAVLYLGDCLEILPTLPKVDAVVTDPPYGIGIDYGAFHDSAEDLRLLAIAVWPSIHAAADTIAMTPGVRGQWNWPQPDWVLAWECDAGAGMCSWGFSTWQPILVYGKDPYLAAGQGARHTHIKDGTVSDKLYPGHPCPKPPSLMRKIIDRVTFGQTILDPFMGSGTTGVACMNLGRKFIGIEIEPKYYEIACERIENAQRQMRMFA